jgi:2-oxo-4-hydroxy-4-carboxy-5-ureidoimidazoline decarboxylase
MEPRPRIDDEAPEDAREILRESCGSELWVQRMMARRPFGTRDALLAAAREEWFALSETEWQQAFGDHPRIGDRAALRDRFGAAPDLPGKEQAGVKGASEEILDALARGNREYLDRFGYIFIVCATGLSAEEMLDRLHARLGNDPWTEIRVAAEEHARITELRLRNNA